MAKTKVAHLKVTQTGSPIGRDRRQRANLIGLGLNKMSRSRVWPDSPAVRGRIDRVHHLVRVEVVEAEDGGTKGRKTKA